MRTRVYFASYLDLTPNFSSALSPQAFKNELDLSRMVLASKNTDGAEVEP